MKRFFRYLAAAMIGVAAFAACSTDDDVENKPEPQPQPQPEQSGVIITASTGDIVRTSFNDGENIKWQENDKVTAWFIDAGGDAAYELREEATIAAEHLSEDALMVTLPFTTIPVGGKAWLAVGSNTGYDGCSARKVEFNYNKAQTQAAAGEMNKEYIRLVSDKAIAVEEAGATYSSKMKIVGSILRFMPYSATGAYAAEMVKSVQLVSSDNAIAGASAAIAYNFADYYDTEAGYKWHTTVANQFSDECVIFWDATSKAITTTLTTPLSLEGVTSADEPGTGIYMAVPPVSVGGYKYVVETDVARYTFDASTTAVKFNDNEVKNVLLNLEHEQATRIELSAVKGDLQYIGDLNAATQRIAYTGATKKDGGYWYAQTRDTGADWVSREGAENAQFYTGVTFEIIDNATGEAADWVNVYYQTDGNTHWWIDADAQVEDGAERSATVTATFPDVDGYVVTEACRTKTLTITQQAYTTVNTLGFGGGVGDQVIAGKGVDKLSLGWCVISVNGVYAEDWVNNSHNEQELYGSVVIECRDGGAGAPIVDWLTVEYGKDDEGKFNSTHLLATASENNTGAERRALVCCTYNAPEGYEFDGGAKSFFRQFFVTQPVNSDVSTIEFWGGIGAEFQHNETAQQDWGLSYWVVNVDGVTATDWANDTHNEQAIYGAATFKCYDYTSGVRGAEVDWVKVEYKKDGDGKVIDTWWLADIEENTTGAVRKAEVVCTFGELEGYVYKNGQNVKTTIITQSAGATAPDTGGDSGDESGYKYSIVKNNGNPAGALFGMPVGGANGADFRIENITYNGATVTLDAAKANELMGKIFKCIAGRPEAGYDHFETTETEIYPHVVSFNGSTMEVGVATTPESQGKITRFTWYGADETEAGYWFVFVP